MSKTYLLLFLFSFSLHAQTWQEFFIEDTKDTLSTGMPVALSAAALWYYANRVPHDWQTLEGPVADFVYSTWKEQGYVTHPPIVLKLIPSTSVLGKMVSYTQELPGAVGVGQPFVDRLQKLLDAKKFLLKQSRTKEVLAQLQEVEDELDECRFVCGHERVHKEKHHTYKLLGIQLLAPFFAHSGLKHTRAYMQKHAIENPFNWRLSRSLVRSGIELFTFIIFARYVECNADMYASQDIRILKAGLRLFERAQEAKSKRSLKRSMQRVELLLKWLFKYTHPTLLERIVYMKKRIAYLEKYKGQKQASTL